MVLNFNQYYITETKKKISSKNKGGECFQLAYRYMSENGTNNKNLKLVHGLVTGQGPIKGIVYNHAWCEDGDTIIDMTLNPNLQTTLPVQFYYALGNIKIVYKYNYLETISKSLESETYGPWEEILLKNPY